MQQNLINKIHQELDMIRILSKLSSFANTNEVENLESDYVNIILKDIEKRCWKVSKLVEDLSQNSKIFIQVNKS